MDSRKCSISSKVFGIGLIVMLLAACAPGVQAGQSTITPEEASGDYAEMLEGLLAAGATIDEAEAVEQYFLSVPGQSVKVDGADVQVFEYADAATRKADSDTIPEDGSSFPTIMITWIDQPHFWAQGELIVLYVGSDQATIELLSELLGDPIAG